ncbi:MAG: hypothetical protein EPO26_03745 [Chloroflexota bacterium]|nr:MAG: hypothetical protein EPO26_03745 [Chloroflexota bacterium]
MSAPPSSAAHEVDVARIERELVALLHAPENLSPNGIPASRTAVLNLVAYAGDRGAMERVNHTLAALVDHHPSRTIVAMVENALPVNTIEAWVQAHCKALGTTGMRICVEQIVLEAQPEALRRLPNAILALLVADLPVVLWWPGEPSPRDPLLYDLLKPAFRMVVDTADFTHLERSLSSLATLGRRPGLAFDMVDLSWERLTPWREMIAQFWDVAAWRAGLRSVHGVEIDIIENGDGRSSRSQGLLLAGWLASRLGWRARAFERLTDGYRLVARRGRTDVEIRVTVSRGSTFGMRRVMFATGNRRQSGSFLVESIGHESARIEVETTRDAEPFRRISRLEEFSEAELLAAALDTLRGEVVFEDALEAVVEFLTISDERSGPRRPGD